MNPISKGGIPASGVSLLPEAPQVVAEGFIHTTCSFVPHFPHCETSMSVLRNGFVLTGSAYKMLNREDVVQTVFVQQLYHMTLKQ